MKAAKAKLDTVTAVLVENRILQLAMDPIPAGSTQDGETGNFQLRVPETDVEIVYQFDEEMRRIRVGTLLTSDSDVSSQRSSGE